MAHLSHLLKTWCYTKWPTPNHAKDSQGGYPHPFLVGTVPRLPSTNVDTILTNPSSWMGGGGPSKSDDSPLNSGKSTPGGPEFINWG